MTFAIVKQLLSGWHVGMANYCFRQNITNRGSALGGNVLPQAVIRQYQHTLCTVIVYYWLCYWTGASCILIWNIIHCADMGIQTRIYILFV